MQARLTVWSIIVMALIVGFVSTLDLADEINRQFQSNRQRAEAALRIAVDIVVDALHTAVTTDALNNRLMSEELQPLLSVSHTLIEIAVSDPSDRILADTQKDQVGKQFPVMDSFSSLVDRTNWWDKLRLLLRDKSTYRISQDLAVSGEATKLLTVHTVVQPASIRDDIMPSIQAHVGISIASIAGAMLAALLFSTAVFRPLGKLDELLDTMTRGDEPESGRSKPPSNIDAVGAVTSKVSVLGQRLRGAKSEVSDLKDHIAHLLDELEDAVLIFGRDRRLIAAAGSIGQFVQRPRAELLGRPLTEIFPATTSLGLLLAQALQTGRPLRNRRVPLTHEARSEGRMPVALLTVEMMDPGPGPAPGAGLVIRLRDPEATRKIGRQLQLADRLSAISQLTGGVAHEVKNPLNAMFMHVELARMKMARGDCDLEPQMDVISNEIMRLDRVVKTFLDFTRPVKLEMAEIPLDAFVNDLVELARPQAAAAGIEIVVKQSPESVLIHADTDLLKQAALNIVVNAIEAMPEGGTLTFESGVKGDTAEIRISDTGPGIPPELKDKIYNLYFTTKTKGSGIGLAMTFRIVQLHDGTIDLSSEPGKGTTFVMRFPVAVEAA